MQILVCTTKCVTDLHLHRLAVDELDAGDEVLENDCALRARVEHDAVHFALDGQSGVAAAEHVHHVVHVCILYHQIRVALLVFLYKG